jgi:glycosyltransferase involved in cell wall biosynthesis
VEISLIVATYDRPAGLASCLESLLAQRTARTVEIIVVDNHPQSGAAAPLVEQFPSVRWLQEPVAGLSRARNRGIAAASGTVLVTTDDDVVAPPEWLELLTAPLFRGLPGLSATTGNCLPPKVVTQAEVLFEAYGGLRHGDRPAEFDHRWLAQWRICFPQLWRIGTTANAAFLTSLFQQPEVGLFETRLGAGSPAGAWEDLYCFYRMLRAGHCVRYLPEAQVRHSHREDMPGLVRQLCGYRRGEVAFLTLILLRHRDGRALGQCLLWIPWWRFSLAAGELLRRLRGGRRFPFSLLWWESLAYLAGPWSLWRPTRACFLIARAWHATGAYARAIRAYRRVLALDPAHLEASLRLGALLHGHHQAIEIYRQALVHHPQEARLHKVLVHSMLSPPALKRQGQEAVFRYYELKRKDSKHLSPRPTEILCCLVLRNELPRLPYFLDYYRKQGIGRFLAVDNGSSDGSLEYLLQHPDVYVWQSEFPFHRANFGAGWFELILRRYGLGHWCLIVDADELLYYPDCEQRSVVDLCRELDRKKKRAFNAILLDMYSDQPIRGTRYAPGQAFQEVCPYFDRRFYHKRIEKAGPYRNHKGYFGGARQRIFGAAGEYCLSKVPLLKYEQDCILAGGQHWTNLPPQRIAAGRGCLLHFKYFSSFQDYVSSEITRREHYDGAVQYREYGRVLSQEQSLSFYDPAHSVRLQDSAQLVRLGIIQP